MFRLVLTAAILLALSVPAIATAQCASQHGSGTIQPGETDPANSCFYCNGTTNQMDNLPAGTRCGDDQQVHCDGGRVWVARCQEMTAGEEASMYCEENSFVSNACPLGFVCDVAQQSCKQTCASDADCQAGYECDANACERLPEPDMGSGGGEDMGSGGEDMGSGGGEDMGTGGGDDMGTTADGGTQPDMGGGKDGDDSGCCSTAARAPSPAALGLLFLGLVIGRRRRRAKNA